MTTECHPKTLNTVRTTCAGPKIPALLCGLLGLVSCVTSPSSRTPSVPATATPKMETTKETPVPAHQAVELSTSQLLEHLKSIELAYARGLCDQVSLRSEIVRAALEGTKAKAIPLSVELAMIDCAARQNSQDVSQANRAVEMMDNMLTNLAPPWDRSYILTMKAARLEASGRPELAIKARQQIAAIKDDQRREHVANQLAILRLDPRAAKLSAGDKNHLSKLLEQASDEERLFDTLRAIDAARTSSADSVPSTPDKTTEWDSLLRELRESVLVRIEERFAAEQASLVQRLQSGSRDDANQMAEKLALAYPSLTYQKRLQSTLSAFDERATAMPIPDASSETGNQADLSDLSEAQRLTMATQSLSAGRPDEAVKLLRSVPEAQRSPELRKRLAEAEAVHIRDLRLRVRDLLERASARSSTSDRTNDYTQARDILQFILKEYPGSDARKQIERNIRRIEFNLAQISKTKDN